MAIGLLNHSGSISLEFKSLEDPEFTDAVRSLIRLRKDLPLLRQADYVHGTRQNESGWPDIRWLDADAQPMHEDAWHKGGGMLLLLADPLAAEQVIAVVTNPTLAARQQALPAPPGQHAWEIVFRSSPESRIDAGNCLECAGHSLTVVCPTAR